MNYNFLILSTLIIILGLIIGSFLNVIIYRYPKMLKQTWRQQYHDFFQPNIKEPPVPKYNLFLPRSFCPSCKHLIQAKYNIPIVSYLWLRAKCFYCREKISYRYPLVETLNALAYFMVFYHVNLNYALIPGFIISSLLIVITFIDIEEQLIPDAFTIPWLWLGLMINTLYIFTSVQNAIIGAVAGYLSLWLVNQGYKLIAKQEGIGYGDFKVLAMLGAWLGWQVLPLIILFSAGLGALFGLILIFFKKWNWRVPIPYGPYLAFSGWIALLWGNSLINWYSTWYVRFL